MPRGADLLGWKQHLVTRITNHHRGSLRNQASSQRCIVPYLSCMSWVHGATEVGSEHATAGTLSALRVNDFPLMDLAGMHFFMRTQYLVRVSGGIRP